MHGITAEAYVEAFIEYAVERIHTPEELDRFLEACDTKIAEASDDQVHALLMAVKERVSLEVFVS